jgi:nucleotide-binding universal stress UspA family protein
LRIREIQWIAKAATISEPPRTVGSIQVAGFTSLSPPAEQKMSSSYRILVAIDLKPGTDYLLAETRRYAQALDATVDIIHVAAPDPDLIGYIKSTPEEQDQFDVERKYHAKELRSEHQQTQDLAAKLRASGVRVDQALTVQGPTLARVLEEAHKLRADLLILGSHHHGALYRLWYGDIAAGAAKQARCALLVVPV